MDYMCFLCDVRGADSANDIVAHRPTDRDASGLSDPGIRCRIGCVLFPGEKNSPRGVCWCYNLYRTGVIYLSLTYLRGCQGVTVDECTCIAGV